MLGGYQILDLRNIDLSRSTSASDITNAYVLNQLLKLREHIEKSYDFSKALNNQLKPVLIRYRDKKVGEKHESAVFGALEVINTYYKFKIVAENNGEKLTIDVEFEEKTYEENEEKYWDIKTAKILLTVNETIKGDLVVEGSISGNEIIENMSGYSCSLGETTEDIEINGIYAGIVKNGNKLSWVLFLKIKRLQSITGQRPMLGEFNVPTDILEKLIPTTLFGENLLLGETISATNESNTSGANLLLICVKTATGFKVNLGVGSMANLTQDVNYLIRIERTFMLSDNLITNQ